MNMAPISQYQFAHVAADKIEVRLIVKRELTDDEENNIANWVNKKFGYPFDISFSYPQELALTKAGKFKDFIVEFRN